MLAENDKTVSMISVIIPTLNPEKRFSNCLAALIPAVLKGMISEVIVVDGGSTDPFVSKICDSAGAEYLQAPRGRGTQMAAGAEIARGKWLLFLHSDTVLEQGWEEEVSSYIEYIENGERKPSAAAFKFALDDFGTMPRILESLVSWRCFLFKLPYGDQGLLVPKQLYQDLGGFKKIPLMEDVDIVQRLGRRRVIILRHHAVTSALRFKNEGYFFRSFRNISCLMLYYLRVPPRYIERLYG